MKNDFYRAFEDRFRGSRELILSRLKSYAPLLDCLKTAFQSPSVLDLGCGRGEWLELLESFGIKASGVDLDEGMLIPCREQGFDVRNADALDYVSSLPTESVDLVTAFHMVEHIPFEILISLVSEVFRVLKPGGLLIMETPNPENISVASEHFYLDPSHVKPIPSGLLSFIPEFVGFTRTTIIKLQETYSLTDNRFATLFDVLTGVSPDYAVITQKNGDPKVVEIFNKIFSDSTGLSLSAATSSFENRMRNYDNYEFRFDRIEAEYASRFDRIEAEYKKQISDISSELCSVYDSRSWRITRPFRRVADFLRSHGITKRNLNIKSISIAAMKLAIRVPGVKKIAGFILKPFPALRLRAQFFLKGMRNSTLSNESNVNEFPYNKVYSYDSEYPPVDIIIHKINAELGN